MDSDWPPGPFPHQRAGRARRIWRWIERHDGLLTAIATIILAAITLFLWIDSNGQLKTIQRQVHEMEAARRPWVPAKATVSLPLSYNAGVGSVPTAQLPTLGLLFQLKNVGNSPAFNVNVTSTSLYRWPNTKTVLAYQDERCEIRKATPPVKDTTGYTLFPGDELVPFEVMVTVPMGQEEAKFWRDNIDEFALFVVGCVSYTDDRRDRFHTTPFSYRITPYSQDGKSIVPTGPKPRTSVDAAHVLLTPDVTANPD